MPHGYYKSWTSSGAFGVIFKVSDFAHEAYLQVAKVTDLIEGLNGIGTVIGYTSAVNAFLEVSHKKLYLCIFENKQLFEKFSGNKKFMAQRESKYNFIFRMPSAWFIILKFIIIFWPVLLIMESLNLEKRILKV